MRKRKRNGAGTYHGKHYYKEEELKERFDLMFGLMDDVKYQRIIHDPPCRGTIDIAVIRNAVKTAIEKRRQDNG